MDGFSARKFSDTNIDLPPHPDYGWLPELRLAVKYFSLTVCDLDCLCNLSGQWVSLRPCNTDVEVRRAPLVGLLLVTVDERVGLVLLELVLVFPR